MFDDRKAKSRTAGRLRAALIDTVETLKNPLLMLRRDPDPGILYREEGMSVLRSRRHRHRSVLLVITDRIVAQVVDQFLHELPVRKDRGSPAADADHHILLLRVHLEHVHAFLCKREQIQIFILHILFPAIELGKLDDIVDQ